MAGLGLTHANEAAFQSWLVGAWLDSGCTQDFCVLKSNPSYLTMEVGVRVAASGHKVNVWWGDGTSNSYSPTPSTNTQVARTFASGAVRPVVIVGRVTRFDSSLSGNRSDFGGDITGLRSLTYLSWGGSNTGSGSVTGMPLTVLSWGGSNTGTGSVTGMPLTYLSWAGNNTGTGSVTGMPLTVLSWGGSNTGTGSVTGMSLTYLYWAGSNTGTGSVTGMPLTYLSWTGNNTGTGWGSVAATATGLCYLYHGGLTVLDSAEVNAILAGFWANRDAAKSRAERVIDIGKDTPTPNGAPTGQGITDKAALQAYRSPNPPGTAALWTVTTN